MESSPIGVSGGLSGNALFIIAINWPGSNVGKYFMIPGHMLATLTCVPAADVFQGKIIRRISDYGFKLTV